MAAEAYGPVAVFNNPALTVASVTWAKEVLIMGDIISSCLAPLEDPEATEEKGFVYLSDPDWARDWIEEGLAKGRAEGLEKGIAQGREEGRVEMLGVIRQNLYRQTRSRFDPQTAELLIQRIDQISNLHLLLKISRQIDEHATSTLLLKFLKAPA